MPAWPSRPAPRRGRLLPAAARAGPAVPAEAPAPQLVPRTIAEAWGALLVLLATIALVAALGLQTAARALDAPIPALVAYIAIGIGTVITLAVYLASVIAHVLPTALGIRRR